MRIRILILFVIFSFASSTVWAGTIFLTGHDPDFHATVGANAVGSQNIINSAMNFVNGSANSFVTAGINKFLFVESNIPTPGGHLIGRLGMIASGFAIGADFEQHNASTLAAELGLLGTKYSALVIASDFGGLLTQAELNILNANSASIINFLNLGGGLFAMSESGLGVGLTSGGHYGYLPFVVSSAALGQAESGNVLTPFGASLGLVSTDIDGNFSHGILFNGSFGLNIVDTDTSGNILTLAGAGTVGGGGVTPVPEPTSLLLLGCGLAGLAGFGRKKLSKKA